MISGKSLGVETSMINREPRVHAFESDDIVTCHEKKEVPTRVQGVPALREGNMVANSESSSSKPTLYMSATTKPKFEEPSSPDPEHDQYVEPDMEDYQNPNDVPNNRIFNMKQSAQNLQTVGRMELQEHEMSYRILCYELPDSHPLLHKFDRRQSDDPCPYLLAILEPDADSIQSPEKRCRSQGTGGLCDNTTCYPCSNIREANSQIVRGTILVPSRTATRGAFPLNGTYFQVNEVFADHDSSLNPVDVPRSWISNLTRRTVYFGTSIQTICRAMSIEEVMCCFGGGFVCVRGFKQCSRSPRPLRLHFPKNINSKGKEEVDEVDCRGNVVSQ